MGGNASGGASEQEYMAKAERRKDKRKVIQRRNIPQISCPELPLVDPKQGAIWHSAMTFFLSVFYEIKQTALYAGLAEVKSLVFGRVAMGMTIIMGVQHKLFARGYVPEVHPRQGVFPIS